MKIIKSLFIFCIIIVSLNSCGTFSEAGKVLRNEKMKSTDEFLIKKKDPLTQPPDFNTIPEPGSVVKKSKNSIEKIIKGPQAQSSNSQRKASSTENSILNQIK